MITNIKQFTVQYWFTKQLQIDFYKRGEYLYMTLWHFYKLTDIPGYESEWGSRWWKHFKLWQIR